MLPARLFLRRLGAVAWTAFAILAITAGVVVGLGRLLLPFADRLEPRLEAWLSEEFQRPVEIGDLGAAWELTGPEFRLTGMRFLNPETGEAGLSLSQAQVGVNLLAWLWPAASPLEFRIADARLMLERGPQGRLRVQGLAAGSASGEGQTLEWLLRQGRISLVDAQVGYTDPRRGLRLRFHDVNVTLDNRGMSHRITGAARVSAQGGGRLEWRILLQGDVAARGIRSARFYLQGEQVDLQAWLQGSAPADVAVDRGQAGFRFWGRVEEGRLQRVIGALQVNDFLAHANEAAGAAPAGYALDHLGGELLWERLPRGWRLSGEGWQWMRAGHAWPRFGFTVESNAGQWRFGADYLRLEDLAPLAQLSTVLPPAWRDALRALAPRGTLHAVTASWHPGLPPGQALTLRARLEEVGWRPLGDWPGLTGVSGRLVAESGAGSLRLATPRLGLDYPGLFRQPWYLEGVQSRLRWRQTGTGWKLQVPRLVAEAQGAELLGRLKLEFQGDGSRPFIDLRGTVTGGGVTDAKQFWPVGIMPEEVVGWLDQALVGGRLVRGRVMAYGDLDYWPFDGGTGRFEVRGQVSDATLDYRTGWPRVTQASAEVLFQGRSMEIVAHSGSVLGAKADRVTARIADLETALLQLDIEAHGAASALLRFLRESPLNRRYGAYLAGLNTTGRGRVATHIALPLDAGAGKQQVTGNVWLDHTQVQDAKWGAEFSQVSGRIRFDQQGFFSEDLSGRFRGQPVALQIAVGGHAPAGALVVASLRGALTPTGLLAPYPWLQPLAATLKGAAAWRLELTVPETPPSAAAKTGAVLRLASDLEGVTVALPAPLGKPASQAVPFTLALPLPYDGGVLQFHYGDRLAAKLWPAAPGGLRGQLRFGAMQAELPDQDGVFVTGAIHRLDLDGWLAATALAAGGAPVLERVKLQVQELRALGRVFHDMQVNAVPVVDAWRVSLTGAGVKGELRLPSDRRQGLVGDFETLMLPPPEGAGDLSLDPRRLPALHLVVQDFTFGNARLGRTRLEAYPIPDGLRVDLLRTENENTGVTANGTWTVTAEGSQRSVFDLTIAAQSLGRMLDNFGYAGLVEGGPTLARLAVSWPGAPSSFALERLGGEMQVSVGAGRLVPVEPGAGRIFGLLSLQALPRRLMLDFSDFFGEGLSFDTITGNFRFDDGVAWTDDLLLKGPAARIEVTGRVDMTARTYDQVVSVYPSVGTTLPLVGALAAGPTGAAALFLLQSVFQEQIRVAASYRYAVTGPWSDPQLELLEIPPPDVTPPLKPPAE